MFSDISGNAPSLFNREIFLGGDSFRGGNLLVAEEATYLLPLGGEGGEKVIQYSYVTP
jgi:hypothetical protein